MVVLERNCPHSLVLESQKMIRNLPFLGGNVSKKFHFLPKLYNLDLSHLHLVKFQVSKS